MTKEEVLTEVQKEHWNVQGFNGLPIHLLSAAHDAERMVGKILPKSYRHFFYTCFHGRANMYYDESDWQGIADAFYETIKNKQTLADLIETYNADYRKSVARAAVIPDGSSAEELIVLAQAFSNRLMSACGSAHAIEGITFGSEHILHAVLSQKGAPDSLTLSKLSSPIYPSFLSEARFLLWKIKKAEGEEKNELAKTFLKEYAWIENSYLGSAKLTIGHVFRRAEELTSEPDLSEFDEIMKEKEAIMEQLSFNDRERFVVYSIDQCFKWQDDRKKNILESIEAFDPILDRLAVVLGLSPVAVKYATPEELTVEKLTSPKFKSTLQERVNGVAFYTTSEGISLFGGDDFTFLVDKLHIPFDGGAAEIKGMVASRGLVTGVVRICESVSDIAKVQQGEILVASMTRPEYLSAMQRASGFITNEGGLTCHAAIISRELKKPCIIGTKIATKTLKDGDLVEMDANTGIVRILQRA